MGNLIKFKKNILILTAFSNFYAIKKILNQVFSPSSFPLIKLKKCR